MFDFDSETAALFDGRYYCRRYDDVPRGAGAARAHFVANGAAEGRIPNALFDPEFYVSRYPDVAHARVAPFEHYCRFGRLEDRAPHPLFDVDFYLAAAPEARGSALAHYLAFGGRRLLDPHPLFDARFYTRPEDGEELPIVHYLETGWRTGRNPTALFDVRYYLANNQDVAEGDREPLGHYVLDGEREGRRPSPFFDAAFYHAQNLDVPHAALAHYVRHGFRENRAPAAFFDGGFYTETQLGGDRDRNPLAHYVTFGRALGLPASPIELGVGWLPRAAQPCMVRPRPIHVVISTGETIDATLAAIAAIAAAELPDHVRLSVDGADGPEPRVRDALRSLGERHAAAPAPSPFADILLVAATARPHGDWIARLARAAETEPRPAAVVPFTNVPGPTCLGTAGSVDDAAHLDRLVADVNGDRACTVAAAPSTAIYLTRAALDRQRGIDPDVPAAHAVADLIARWTASGERIVLAAGVFVGSAGDDRDDAAAAAADAFCCDRYPTHAATLALARAYDATAMPRLCAALGSLRAERSTALVIARHDGPGVACEHLHRTDHGASELLVEYLTFDRVRLSTTRALVPVSLVFDARQFEAELLLMLRSAAITHVHVVDVPDRVAAVERLVAGIGAPFDVHLREAGSLGAGERTELDPASWWTQHGWLFTCAARVCVATLEDARHVARAAPFADVAVTAAPSPAEVPRIAMRTRAASLPSARRTIVTVPSRFASGQIDACGYIRLERPMAYHAFADEFAVTSLGPLAALNVAPDCIVVQRTAIDDLAVARELVAHCRRSGIALVYEIDDDLFAIPDDHPEFFSYRTNVAAAQFLARAAAAVVVSTRPLARVLETYNSNVAIVPDTIDDGLWAGDPEPRAPDDADEPLRILYMGTYTHGADAALLEEPMRRIAARFGERVRLEIVGVTLGDAGWFDRRSVPNAVARSYPAFIRWLQAQRGRWSIGLAPLRPSRFNAAKSIVKFLDYSALGLATIVSDVVPYRTDLRDAGYPVVTAANTAGDWSDALTALVERPELRRRLARRARRVVEEHHTVRARSSALRETWRTLTALGPNHATF